MNPDISYCPKCSNELSYSGYCATCQNWTNQSNPTETLKASVQTSDVDFSESVDMVLDAQDRSTYAIRSIAIFLLGSVGTSSGAAFCLWFYSIEITKCEYSCSVVSMFAYLGWGVFGFGMLLTMIFALRELARSNPNS